jgi:hypothetical protein
MNSRERREAERQAYAAWAARQGLNTPADWQRRKRQLELEGTKTYLKIVGAFMLLGLIMYLIMTLIFG